MKEITRRLYTKPVLLGLAFLVGMALLVGLFVTTKSTAAVTTFIPAGDDAFETTNNGESYHNFAASPVPAGFFGTGSQAYSGLVPMEGVPLNPGSDVDTVIHRNQDVLVPGSTTLKMTGLSLKSINPITVTYSNGSQEAWNVRVGLSSLKASTGSMTIGSGGTFDSSLSVFPKFTFTRVSDGAVKVLDTGGSGLTAAASVADATVSDGVVFEPAPEPTIAPAPCRSTTINDFEGTAKFSSSMTSTAASSSCAPVTLTSTNSPWQLCNGFFCIPRPITEAELLASHNASPPGTKKALAQKAIAVGE
jgi:hypothetical protein